MSKHSAGISSQSDFSRVDSRSPQRSLIPLSVTRKHTGNAGDLIPAFHAFCLPGDVWNFDFAVFSRLLTLKFPLMDNLILEWFAFFDADRLVWDNFERMQGFQPDPDSPVDFIFPWIASDEGSTYQFSRNTVADYWGLPMEQNINPAVYKIRSTPFRAYRHIWNEWFRDQNYQDSLPLSGDPAEPRGDGPDDVDVITTVLKRNKRPDYFASSLKAPQKGPEVLIPWANDGQAPVWGDEMNGAVYQNYANGSTYQLRFVNASNDAVWDAPASIDGVSNLIRKSGGFSSQVYADVGSISASLNALRESVVLQQIYELDARGGTRYSESLINRWNVDAGDARLQRPEFIAAGTSHFSVSQVAQTSPTVGGDAQASLAAYAEMSAVGHVNYTCVEHGHLLILINVRAPLTYQQGLNRLWLASSRFDLPEPLTMNLGERAVMSSEIYYPPSSAEDVWGYMPIWSEYLYMPSFVTGLFRSDAPGSLDPWHLALDYEAPPVHNEVWIQDAPPVDRVVQNPSSQPQFKFDCLAKGKIARAMPANPVPGLLRF